MKYSFKSLFLPVILFLLAALGSCKESTLINSKVSPADNTVGVFDTTLSVITHTYYDDTALTSLYLGLPVYHGLGTLKDPFFGTMEGTSYFQVLPANATNALYIGKTIDSIALVMPYSGVTYGDTADQSATQTYQVFYIQDTMSIATDYFSYSTKPIDNATPLSAPTPVNVYHLKDSVSVNGVNYLPSLRIMLNVNAVWGRLSPALDVATTSANPTTDFLNAFHGICVKVADSRQSGTAIPYMQLDGDGITDYSGASLIVYYHTNGNATDSSRQRFYFNPTYCAFFNGMSKSYSRYPVNQLLHTGQANDSIIALQNQPGTNLDVVIPGLKNLPKGIINKAELQLVLLPNYASSTFLAPARLNPIGVGNGNYPTGIIAGLTYNIADRYPLDKTSPYTVIDGTSHNLTATPTLTTYTIGIPREVMTSIASNNDTVHLHITGSQDFYGAYHMVAGGGNHPNPLYRAKIFIVYSLLSK